MPCYEAKISSKGQVTLPVEVRRFYNLQEGDRVDFYIEPGTRTVRLMARNAALADLHGLVTPGEPISQQEIDDAIGDHLVADDDRIKASWNERHEFEQWRKAKSLKAAK